MSTAASEIVKTLWDALRPIAEAAKAQHIATTLNLYRHKLEWVDACEAAGKDLDTRDAATWIVHHACYEPGLRPGEYVKRADADASLVAVATRQGDAVAEDFLRKVGRKLGVIVDRRAGDTLSVKSQSTALRAGVVEGVLFFTFTNPQTGDYTAAFEARLQVIWAQIGRTEYVRHPLTFHSARHVVDGKMVAMKGLSQAKMAMEF